MVDAIPPSKEALAEAGQLAEDILANIELSQIPLYKIALKASRLARLCNDFDFQKIFEYEASGYPIEPTGVHPTIWRLAQMAGRGYTISTKEGPSERVYCGSIESIENNIETLNRSLDAAKDANVSVSSANPNQWVSAHGNLVERDRLRQNIAQESTRLSSRRAFVHSYASSKYYELKFSGIADDIFSRVRESFDRSIGEFIPDSIQKISAIYSNLVTDNPEDWSNAVHGCRRLLQDLADRLYPACEDRVVEKNGKTKTIRMGPDNYINRLIAFVEDRSESDRFKSIVGSHLGFLGDRLDAIFRAAQKGSHSTIKDRAEADRYVLYTYMIVGDILSLTGKVPVELSGDLGPGNDGRDEGGRLQ